MTHDEARLLIGAAPAEIGEPLAAHLAQCPACTLFQQQMRRMDRDLARLFSVSLPPRADTRVLPLPLGRPAGTTRTAQMPGLMALAASVILCVGMGALFWALRPQPSLAAGVIRHIQWESGSWSAVAPMTAAATAQILADAGASLDPADTTVTYARSCLFDGHWVPHLVVRTQGRPITVMVLRQEHVAARQSFRQNGYSGMLLPIPTGGTLAVVAQGDTDLEALTRTLDPHLHWTR
jgi:Protein of unknown function (DUF3379)